MSLFSVQLDPEQDIRFHAKSRISGDPPLYGRFGADQQGRDDLVQWCMQRFIEAVRARIPELERLKTNEWYYNGFHWQDPIANRENQVRNFVFATIETVHPILTEVRPRPEVVLRRAYGDEQKADDANDAVTWLMDVTGWDYSIALGEREKLKHGYSVYLVNVDNNGLGRAMPWSNYDFYRDPAATNDDEMEYYFLARPLATDFVVDRYADRKKRPWLFDETGECVILPDNLLSPSYDAIQRPFDEAHRRAGVRAFEPDNIIGAVMRLETEEQTAMTTSLVRIEGTERRRYGRTSFLIQMVVRDRTVMHVHYSGDVSVPDGAGAYNYLPIAQTYRRPEACSESGWRVISFLADGTFLDSTPLDPCYGGRNVEIDRDYPQLGRFECPGEADHIIPINRSINKRLTGVDAAQAFELDPVLVMDTGAGNNLNNRNVVAGDVIRKNPGTEVHFLDPPKSAFQNVEMLGIELSHMDTISGVHDVTEGRRPEGIEAAAAIRSLQNAAQTRIRGKEVPGFAFKVRLLKKMLRATAKKAPRDMLFMASDGQLKVWDSDMFLGEYDLRLAPGTGTAVGRALQEDKVMELAKMGLIDQQTALERLNVKGVPQILMRLSVQQAQEAQAAAAAKSVSFQRDGSGNLAGARMGG